jgi:hypothetical protein
MCNFPPQLGYDRLIKDILFINWTNCLGLGLPTLNPFMTAIQEVSEFVRHPPRTHTSFDGYNSGTAD